MRRVALGLMIFALSASFAGFLMAVPARAQDKIPPTPPFAITPHVVTMDDYPPEAIATKQSGVVQVRYVIGTDRNVSDVTVTMSSGFPLLDDGAIRIVKGWKFKPAKVNGQPVAFRISDTKITFKLTDPRPSTCGGPLEALLDACPP